MRREGAAPGGELVLAVDDEPLVLRVLERILTQAGHRVALATSAEALQGWLTDHDLAVVLLDLRVGPVDGAGLLARIKRERGDVEVVVITGHGSVDSAVGCMRGGAFDYLEKPFRDLSRIRATVGAALAKRRAAIEAEAARDAAIGEAALRASSAGEVDVPLSLAAYERLALERALQESRGDAARAARSLGIGRSTFYRKAAKLGIALGRAPVAADVQIGESTDGEGRGSARVGRGPSIG